MVVTTDFLRDRPVLVTGGTGFIGRRLALALLAQGARLRVLIRSQRVLPSEWQAVEIVTGALEDRESLMRACRGVDTVFHAAGFAHAEKAYTSDFAQRHWVVNAEGVFRLLDAAVATGVRRFVLISSVKAVGDPGPHCVDETWSALPDTPYGQAKRAAEERVLTVGREQGIHVVNLRPALVYGPGMKANLGRLIAAMRRGWLPPLPETGNRRSLVHVDDVAQAAMLAAVHPAAAGKTYFVTDGLSYSGQGLYRILRRALHRPIPRWSVPPAVLYVIAAGVDGLLRLRGDRERKAWMALDKLLGWACYDSSRIRIDLGYRPVWTLARYCQESGLAE